mmetsp:Transcript_6357/g.21743  ORF Transcript_6357/g.21743 Transcript_6357/m.21743 type:complete len:204 (+) Transcript_6357:52-663(+)
MAKKEDPLLGCIPRPEQRPSPYVATPTASFVGSFIGLGGLVVIQWALRKLDYFPDPLLAIGSFAALATLLYAAPAAPLGKPYNMFYGHFLSIVVAIVLHKLGELAALPNGLLLALTPSLAIAVMVHQKVPHPPAAACAFIFEAYANEHEQRLGGIAYLLAPGLIGCAYMLAVQAVVHYGADALYAYVQKREAERAQGDNQDML